MEFECSFALVPGPPLHSSRRLGAERVFSQEPYLPASISTMRRSMRSRAPKPRAPFQSMPVLWMVQMLLSLRSSLAQSVSSWTVKTIAGNLTGSVGVSNFGYADGVGTAASFYSPSGVSMDSSKTFAVVVRLTIGETYNQRGDTEGCAFGTRAASCMAVAAGKQQAVV